MKEKYNSLDQNQPENESGFCQVRQRVRAKYPALHDNKNVYIQISNSRTICGVWTHEPNDLERTSEYSKYMKNKMNVEAMRFNTWVEKHVLIKTID